MADFTDPANRGQGRKPRSRSLRTLQQVRRLASDAVRYVEKLPDPVYELVGEKAVLIDGILPTDRARLMLYGAQILGRIIPLADIEPRIRALEEKRAQPAAPH